MNVKCVNFDDYFNEISFIRNCVFVKEQNIPIELEWDGQDHSAFHYLTFTNSNDIIAYARLYPSGKLGRVAVLKAWRNQGIGSLMISTICDEAHTHNLTAIHLSSQISAMPFYTQLGFQITGEILLEAEIEHQAMHTTLK